MSELFYIYQDNLYIIFNKITRLMTNISSLPIPKFDLVCKDIDMNMREAERMLKQMDIELKTCDEKDSMEQVKIFQFFKAKYEETKSKMFNIKEEMTFTKRMDEMIVSNENTSADDSLQKKLLVKENVEEIADKASNKLELAKRTAVEVEKTSNVIMIELQNQSTQMQHVAHKIENLNQSLNNSNSILSQMINRQNKNKIILGAFSLTLISLLFFILYSNAV